MSSHSNIGEDHKNKREKCNHEVEVDEKEEIQVDAYNEA